MKERAEWEDKTADEIMEDIIDIAGLRERIMNMTREKYMKLPAKEWDKKSPVYSYTHYRFFDEGMNEILEMIETNYEAIGKEYPDDWPEDASGDCSKIYEEFQIVHCDIDNKFDRYIINNKRVVEKEEI